MKKSLIFAAAAMAIVLVSVPQSAKAQIAFGFHGPHGSFSFGVGAPFVPAVGAYVPRPYVSQVYLNPGYGYGFVYNSRWIPVRHYASGWIIAGNPIVYAGPYVHPYGYGYVRPYRTYGYGYVRPYRAYASHGHGHQSHSGHGWDGHH